MKKILIILSLTFILTGISQPPMPPPLTNEVAPSRKAAKARVMFNVSCPHCSGRYRLMPILITTNGFRSTPGGHILERTITFSCPRLDCAEDFNARNEKFAPEPVAVEETNSVPPQALFDEDLPPEPLDSPPIITSFDVRQSTPLDFPIKITFASARYVGPCFDPISKLTATNAFHITWPANSNWFYTSWFGPKLTGSDWMEWPLTNAVQPAKSNFIASSFVPIWNGAEKGSRFYQVRATDSQGITYGP